MSKETETGATPKALRESVDSPPITAADFESACGDAITGWLWDESYDHRYTVPVSLGIAEMRYLANLLRAAQQLPPGVVQEWNGDAENSINQRQK